MRVSGFTSSAKAHLYQKQISDVMSSLSYELLNVNDMLSQLKRKLLHFYYTWSDFTNGHTLRRLYYNTKG